MNSPNKPDASCAPRPLLHLLQHQQTKRFAFGTESGQIFDLPAGTTPLSLGVLFEPGPGPHVHVIGGQA
jgi:hypothetical protein